MSAECYPITVLPHVSPLFSAYLGLPGTRDVSPWYGGAPLAKEWMAKAAQGSDRAALGAALLAQADAQGAGEPARANIARLAAGARAVVTGQQVGLFGGPLLTLLKAATAVSRAAQATAATGVAHVPVFWLASEDHDLAEVDQLSLLSKTAVETLRLDLHAHGQAVGGIALGPGVEAALDRVSELLAYAPVCDLLRACYTPEATLAGAFARFMAGLFQQQGLIVLDASNRALHGLGAPALRAAIEHAGEFEAALLERTAQLEAAGFSAQVLVKPGASLLFLLDAESGARQPLRQSAGVWKAGSRSYSTAELLDVLAAAPERLSPNALLRPVFQDTILPTAAYIGGPAEIAYFAQSAVLYERILGRITPILPRFTATLVEPATAALMARHEVTFPQISEARTAEALALRLGARAMPVEGKRRIAAAGNAMDAELTALTGYLASLDESLGRSAGVSASKMRYQMNRLRRMAATFEVQQDTSLRKQATTLMLSLFPAQHPQERVLGGIWFLARCGDGLVKQLVQAAGDVCPGHSVLRV